MAARPAAPLALVLVLAGCAAAPQEPAALRISSVTQGLMRPEAGAWRVYEPGNTFAFKENERCNATAAKQPGCMWYGVEFDYSAPAPSTILSCDTRMSWPPETFTTSFRAEVKLSGTSGHLSVPAYSAPGKGTEQRRVECSHAGVVVLRYDFTISHGAP